MDTIWFTSKNSLDLVFYKQEWVNEVLASIKYSPTVSSINFSKHNILRTYGYGARTDGTDFGISKLHCLKNKNRDP